MLLIKTKDDLRLYLEADQKKLKEAYTHTRVLPFVWRLHSETIICKLEMELRKSEYYKNCGMLIPYVLHFMSFKHICRSLCSEIPLNVIGKGLLIWHGQRIIINSNSRIGENFSVSSGCVIGNNHGLSPCIGDDVTMHIDSKVLGDVTVANDVQIGTGSIVLRSIREIGSIYVGIPAHNINGS